MSVYISDQIRKLVAERAQFLCEYCLIHETTVFLNHHIEHIISLKHDGSSDIENLAYACVFCNRNKGSDIGTVLLPERNFIRFFNPRSDQWGEHFELKEAFIQPISNIGEATAKILDFNDLKRWQERKLLLEVGKYPPAEAGNQLEK